MTNPNKTMFALVVDRSGSMQDLKDEMNGALGTLLDEQAAEPGDCDVYLAQFDDRYDLVYSGDIKTRPPYLIEPRGMTSLLGAVGLTIDNLGTLLEAQPDDLRPGRVIVAIVTDGLENNSGISPWSMKYADRDKIRQMVEHQQDAYGWSFLYFGANQDAIMVGASLGVPMASSMTYAATAEGATTTSALASAAVSSLRSTGTFAGFTDEDRIAANT